MNPQLAVVVLQFIWDQMSSGKAGNARRAKGGSKKKSNAGGGFRLMALITAIIAALSYFGIGTDKLKELLLGKAEQALTKLEEELKAKAGITGGTQSGPIRVYFTTPPGNPADPNDPAHAVCGYIDAAKQTIDVAGFEVDNKLITEALVKATQRGVRVRLVTDTDYINEYGPKTLAAAGVPVVDDKRSALMHNKFMVFDGTAVWGGSMNFTENCAYRNNNNGIYLAIPELAANYSTKFKWMFEDKKFGGKPSADSRIPNPIVKMPDGTIIENYFATHDRCAEHLIGVIRETKQTLDFMAFSFTHKDIGKAVSDRAAAGVKVRGVFEKTQAAGGFSEYGRFQSLGLSVYLDANPRNMHHKVMVFDTTTTVTGSFNFSSNADKSNDENMLIIRNNAGIAKQFEAEFERVYGAAKGGATGGL